MKSLKSYLVESEQTYKFRIKMAETLSDERLILGDFLILIGFTSFEILICTAPILVDSQSSRII